jgi:hypothetical protein
MQDNGVDMSRVSISRSYAVLVGLEAYVKTRRKFKHGVVHAKEAETKVLHPEEHARKKEEEKDKSKSAERERQILAHKAAREEAEKKEQSWRHRIWKRLSISSSRGGSGSDGKDDLAGKGREEAKDNKRSKWLSKPGQDVESAIPPSSTREDMEKRDSPAAAT